MKPRRAIGLPSADRAFSRVVADLVRRDEVAEPGDLERSLRPLFPRAVVRARELSGEDVRIWYAYRDGRYAPVSAEAWWAEPDAARVRIRPDDGRFVDANDAFVELVAESREGVLGRPFIDFVAPDARDLAVAVWDVARTLAEVATSVRMVDRAGEPVDVDVRSMPDGTSDTVEVAVRRSVG